MSADFLAISSDSTAEAERLNAWMRGQRVVQVGRHLVADGARSFWAECVTVTAVSRKLKCRAPGSPVSERAANSPKALRLVALALQ